jgi:hypothetical protein
VRVVRLESAGRLSVNYNKIGKMWKTSGFAFGCLGEMPLSLAMIQSAVRCTLVLSGTIYVFEECRIRACFSEQPAN